MNIQCFGLASGLIIVGEVKAVVESGWLIQYPGVITMPAPNNIGIVPLHKFIELTKELMEGFELAHSQIIYHGPIEKILIEAYFKYKEAIVQHITGLIMPSGGVVPGNGGLIVGSGQTFGRN